MFFKLLFLGAFIVSLNCSNDANCGTKGPKPLSSYIVNGEPTAANEFPWQCRIARLDDQDQHFCGCSLVKQYWTLTAAHCCTDMLRSGNSSQWLVVAGDHQTNVTEKTESILPIEAILPHPFFDRDSLSNDICLLKLASPGLNLSAPHLGTVCLPEPSEPIDSMSGRECTITGWGQTGSPGAVSTVLRKARMTIWPQADCVKAFNGTKITIDNGMICFGNSSSSGCYGDSGGPLNCLVGDRWYEYGVTSFGSPRCTSPNVDARVSTYSKWIWKTIDDN